MVLALMPSPTFPQELGEGSVWGKGVWVWCKRSCPLPLSPKSLEKARSGAKGYGCGVSAHALSHFPPRAWRRLGLGQRGMGVVLALMPSPTFPQELGEGSVWGKGVWVWCKRSCPLPLSPKSLEKARSGAKGYGCGVSAHALSHFPPRAWRRLGLGQRGMGVVLALMPSPTFPQELGEGSVWGKGERAPRRDPSMFSVWMRWSNSPGLRAQYLDSRSALVVLAWFDSLPLPIS